MRLHKMTLFGICGAMGAFLAALLGEALYGLFMPSATPPPAPPPAHILFLLDVTGSMEPYREGIISGLNDFVASFHAKNIDVRVGLIAYGDWSGYDLNGNPPVFEKPVLLDFGGSAFTADTNDFCSQLSSVVHYDGGDGPESTLDALAMGSRISVPKGAPFAVVLITDAPPKVPDKDMHSIEEVIPLLKNSPIKLLHLVIADGFRATYAPLHEAVPGEVYSLDAVSTHQQTFDKMLPDIATQLVSGIQMLQGTKQVSKSALPQLTLLTSLVSALVAAGIALWLIAAQNRYLGRPLLRGSDIGRGLMGGGIAGAIAGAVAQLLFAQAGGGWMMQAAQRFLAWMLLGGLLGLGIALFVPNLRAWRGVLGGGLGGGLGAAAFLILSSAALGDTLSRLAGWTVLGLCIGLMIAIVETLMREAWLTVHYGPRETRTVGLGREPILIGSDRECCTVYARDAAPVALRYRLEAGRVWCEDVAGQRAAVSVAQGDRRAAGRVEVEVMANTGAANSHLGTTVDTSARVEPTNISARSATSALQGGQTAALPITGQPNAAWTPALVVGRRKTILTVGVNLSVTDIPGMSAAPNSLVAVVRENPAQPGALGLANRSAAAWTVLADGDRTLVEPGKTIRLRPGITIDFGGVTGHVV